MKITITYLCDFADRNDYFISMLPVGTVSLAAYLERLGHTVTLANYSKIGYRAALREIEKQRPEVAGVSVFTHNRTDSLKFLKEMKRRMPRLITVAGGPHAGCLAEEILRRDFGIDYIIRGEGERSFARLLDEIKKGKAPENRIISGARIENPDSLPAPGRFSGAMTGVDANEQFKCIITSRGCPYSCTFCCSPVLWGRRVSFRSARNIVDEIEFLYKNRGIIFFSIRDDNLTLDRKRVLEFCRLLRERRIYIMWNCQSRVDTIDEEMLVEMKLSGLEQVQYGVESGSEKILRMYDKKTTLDKIAGASLAARRAGVYLFFYLMAGMRNETAGDIKKTVALIRRTLPGDGIVSPVALYPCTGLYEAARARGDVDDSIWFKRRDPGIFLREGNDVAGWIAELVTELGVIRERSWYREKDFALHRRVAGGDCWVTDILEGDYYLDRENSISAGRCYGRVVDAIPDNPWGYLRMGKMLFREGEFQAAAENYAAVIVLVPKFYGGWLKLAECQVALNKREEAAMSIEEAYRHNRTDLRIVNLRKMLKGAGR